MSEDHERLAEFTDDDYAFLRFARFGELPPRVRPDERVELTESGHPGEPPAELEVRRGWE